ncbi:MAG: hypothetical protein KJ957_02945 [Candidatus Omnitrophica bacterium]|nr:hypothetical protein [Candidatus Omnitrophota bacterium]
MFLIKGLFSREGFMYSRLNNKIKKIFSTLIVIAFFFTNITYGASTLRVPIQFAPEDFNSYVEAGSVQEYLARAGATTKQQWALAFVMNLRVAGRNNAQITEALAGQIDAGIVKINRRVIHVRLGNQVVIVTGRDKNVKVNVADIGIEEFEGLPELGADRGKGSILDMVRDALEQDGYLKRMMPGDLIERIENAPPGQQQFILNGLNMLIPWYMWVVNEYVNDPALAGKRDEIIREVQNDAFPQLIECLDSISRRLANGDLVPGAVTVNLSREVDVVPEVLLDRKARIAYWPMKGDPWHWGHIWLIWRLLADGYDVVVIMMDNDDPDRKPFLTGLSIREADSRWLFDAFDPFIVYTSFQRELRPLLEADGDTITATVIFENREIGPVTKWLYDAGWDHFYWTYSRDARGQKREGRVEGGEAKIFLDVPYKLFLVWKRLAQVGIATNVSIRFQKRAGDSSGSDATVAVRLAAIQGVANISVIESFASMASEGVDENISEGGNPDFWNDVKTSIRQWEAVEIERVKHQCSPVQRSFLEACHAEGKRALLLEDEINEMVGNWLARFGPATSWEQAKGAGNVLSSWFQELEAMEAKGDKFYAATGEGARLFSALMAQVEESLMVFEVIEQAFDVSSTKIRGVNAGDVGLFYALPIPCMQSAMALKHYPSCQDPSVSKMDKIIAAEVLGYLIDLNLLLVGGNGQITEEILHEHLGKYLWELVDVELLLERLGQRLSSGVADTILLQRGLQFQKALQTTRTNLAQAHGNALHAVDGYLMKWLFDDGMYGKLEALYDADQERQVVNLIDTVRDLIRERTAQIVEEARIHAVQNDGLTQAEPIRLEKQRDGILLFRTSNIFRGDANDGQDFEKALEQLELNRTDRNNKILIVVDSDINMEGLYRILTDRNLLELINIRVFIAQVGSDIQLDQGELDINMTPIVDMEGLQCIPLTDSICEQFESLRTARDFV